MSSDVWSEIKSRINLVEYAEKRMEVKKRGGVYFCKSPINEDTDPSCALYADHFKDWSSGRYGDIFDFIQLTEGVDLAEALSNAADYCGFQLDEKHIERARQLQRERTAIEKSQERFISARCDTFWEWLADRGISRETADAFALGWRSDVRAVSIPIFDRYGRLASISLRRIEGEPKYQHFNTSFFNRSRHLYNMHVAFDNATDGTPIYIVEGQFDVMALHEAGVRTGVASYGEAITAGQASLIKEFAPSATIVYVPDQDENDVNAHKEKQRNAIGVLSSRIGGDVRVATLSRPDANDVLLALGAEQLKSEIEQHRHNSYFLLEEALRKAGTIEAEYEAARSVIHGTGNALIIDDLCSMLSERWEKPKEVVRTYLLGPNNRESLGLIKRIEHGIEAYEDFADSLAHPVFRFPWPTFNDKIRAIAPGHVIGFIARTSVGKTVWLLNLIEHCCNTNRDGHVMFFTLEQPEVEIISRLLAIQSSAMIDPDKEISTREIEMLCRMRDRDNEWNWRKQEFVDHFKSLSIVEQSMTVDEIEATINEGSMTYGPVQVVFIDYLGLIEGRGDEYEHLSHVAKALKNIAKRTGVVMVYLHQLSRKGEDGTRPVTLEMARGSGVIEESVDYLIGAWRPEGTDSPEFAAAILKNKHGRLGDALLYLNPRTLSLTEREEVPVEVIYPETTSGREEVSEAFDWGNDNGEDPFSV